MKKARIKAELKRAAIKKYTLYTNLTDQCFYVVMDYFVEDEIVDWLDMDSQRTFFLLVAEAL